MCIMYRKLFRTGVIGFCCVTLTLLSINFGSLEKPVQGIFIFHFLVAAFTKNIKVDFCIALVYLFFFGLNCGLLHY